MSAIPNQPSPVNGEPGEQTHVNFILLGHQRCGSNLLIRALAEHPQVRMAGEVLANTELARSVGWEAVTAKSWLHPRGPGYQPGQDGAEFLRTKVFADGQIWNSRAFGFKLFFDHASFSPAAGTAWDYLFAHREIRVIHLVRRNLFYALISRAVAERTQTWHRLVEAKQPEPAPLPPFAIDVETCRKYFDEITEQRRAALAAFAHHPTLALEYEADLCDDFHESTRRAYEFLGVMPWKINPGMVKQQKLTAAQQISNFDQLRRKFASTPYAEFFESGDSADSIRSAR